MKEVAAVFMAPFFAGDISTPPAPAPPPPPVIVIKDPFNIFFDKGSAEVTPRMREVLRNAAVAFRLNPADKFIWVRGHADDARSSKANFRLGCRRARAVENFLVKQGIAADRIDLTSGGGRYPLVPGKVGHPYNRRVDLLIEPIRGYPGTAHPEPPTRRNDC